MRHRSPFRTAHRVLAALVVALIPLGHSRAHPSTGAAPPRAAPDIERPVRWLVEAQGQDGGWGVEAKAPPDVATTAISGIALLRLGHTASSGQHQGATRRAVEYVVRAIERAPANEIAIERPGTQPQIKLGRHVDTFLAIQFLSEALPGMPEGPARSRAKAALDAAAARAQRTQRADGSFAQAGDGWAPVLSSAFASSGLRAAQAAGAPVAPATIARTDDYMLGTYDTKSRSFKTGDSAGIQLYTVAGAAQAAVRSGKVDGDAGRAALSRLDDDRFLRGFGTYGGEEHVSYMLTSEALAAVGGKAWDRWDQGIRQRLAGIQRPDGTWRGDHCITSTSFCTAASLITLAVTSKAKPAKS